MNTSFSPCTAPGRSTQAGSPGPLHWPSFTEASQYPGVAALGARGTFHTSRMPSPSLLLTVVLTMVAPQDAQPALAPLAATWVVAEPECSPSGFERLTYVRPGSKVHVGLSQLP